MEKKKTTANVNIKVSDKKQGADIRTKVEFFADGKQVYPQFESNAEAALRALDEISLAFRGTYLYADEFIMRIRHERG